MVLQKRLDYGFIGCQVPTKPRASRSPRGKGSLKLKTIAENQMCAFELLATVAGKLLQERESSPASNNAATGSDQPAIVKDDVKWEKQDEGKPLKVELCDQGSCDESFFISELDSQGCNRNHTLEKFPHAQHDVGLGVTPILKNSDYSGKAGCAKELVIGKSGNEFGNCQGKVKEGSPGNGEFYKGKVEYEIKKELDAEPRKIGSVINGSLPDTYSLEDPIELDRQAPTLVSSDSSVEVPMCRDHIPCGSFPTSRDNVKVFSKDDDETSSGCTQPSTISLKAFRSAPLIGDRRIRKLLASKYWKVAPKLEDREHSNTDGEVKLVYRNRKSFYTRQRSQRNYSFKRRKLFNHSSVSTSGVGFSSEGISTSPGKCANGDATGSGATMHGASGASSSVAGQQASFQSRDSHVKLSIKSFKVPELFVEIPETATVGSLKRTVMEAVTAILGGGLRVGVLLQGKKIRDDNQTLLQTGISHDDKLDSLGFTLESNSVHSPQPLCREEPPFLPPYETTHQLTRYAIPPVLGRGTSDASPDPRISDLGNCIESDNDLAPSPTDMLIDKNIDDSRALVAVPAVNVEALAVVPLHRKSRRSELVQRRIRRPFSVLEVEALVQAVEKLGTGRWRDVKIRAFDNAKHRTYVDLKDKWKTLVHTARISPQQRRGEPVPQELLDRVLSAHSYWFQQQAKQTGQAAIRDVQEPALDCKKRG